MDGSFPGEPPIPRQIFPWRLPGDWGNLARKFGNCSLKCRVRICKGRAIWIGGTVSIRNCTSSPRASDLRMFCRGIERLHPDVAEDLRAQGALGVDVTLGGWPLELQQGAMASVGGTLTAASLPAPLQIGAHERERFSWRTRFCPDGGFFFLHLPRRRQRNKCRYRRDLRRPRPAGLNLQLSLPNRGSRGIPNGQRPVLASRRSKEIRRGHAMTSTFASAMENVTDEEVWKLVAGGARARALSGHRRSSA